MAKITDYGLTEEFAQIMKDKGIDLELTLKILEEYNAGKYDHFEPIKVSGIPEVDGKHIIDVTGDMKTTINLKKAEENIAALGLDVDIKALGTLEGDSITFTREGLEKLGIELYPLLAYGVLNGGSASSYVDYKKNKGFNETLFNICEEEFHSLEKVSKGVAKGLTPAFINKDRSHGPSFLELKMRSVLIEALKYQKLKGSKAKALYPMFQMTSVYNNDDVLAAYDKYKESPMLKELIAETGVDITQFITGVQPMLGAMTHSDEGAKKSIFTKAHGQENNPLPMPGGHGQNFIALKEVYKKLYDQGKRFIYLGNVDNLGFTVNPGCLALVALEGRQAGFEFSFRTPVDVKGGVLVTDQRNSLNCADMGVAISKDEVLKMEEEGKNILFNCATGLFNLKYLVENNDYIIKHLPTRVSDQNKDTGKYSQAEQVTWEVISILNDITIFGVEKKERFLAAKLLLEGLMTSGIGLDDPDYPTDPDPEKNLRHIAENLHNGLTSHLKTVYGMKLVGERWEPRNIDELLED